MKDLVILNDRCAPHWEGINQRREDLLQSNDGGIELFPVVTGDLKYASLVEQMETAYEAYPAVHQDYYPLLSQNTDTIHHRGCAYSIDVQNLNREQLKAICTLADEHTIDRVFPGYVKMLNTTSKEEAP